VKVAVRVFVGLAVLLWLVWVWFGIPEATVWQLLGSASLAVVIVAGTAWVLASVIGGHMRRALVVVVLLLALSGICFWLAQYDTAGTEWLAVRISRIRGRAVNPRHLAWIFPAVRWTIFAVVAFVAAAPRSARSWRYWLLALGLVVAGGYVPWKLVTWVPAVKGVTMQATSMGVRFLLAYTVTVAALVGFGMLLRRLPENRTAATS
jgi:hypothetical protein